MVRSHFLLILIALIGNPFTYCSLLAETKSVSHDASWVHLESTPQVHGPMPPSNDHLLAPELSYAPVPLDEVSLEETHSISCNCGQQSCCHGVCRDPGHPAKPTCEKPGDVNRGDCPPLRYHMDDCKRAGKPHTVAKWAQCSVTDKYSAWFVGGGSAFGCKPFCTDRGRESDEGTWGLDYGGLLGHAKVWLNYTCGREQGGEGQYETDGEPEFVARAKSYLHRD